jgi:hypothetical protein
MIAAAVWCYLSNVFLTVVLSDTKQTGEMVA